MNRTTFACTLLLTDHGTYRAGDVIRRDAVTDAWSDCIILGFSDPKQHNGDVYVRLARPYAYASCVGTTAPGVLMGQEVYEMSASKLKGERVMSSRPMLAHGDRPLYTSEVIDLRTNQPTVDASKLPSKGTRLRFHKWDKDTVCSLTGVPVTKGTQVYSWFENDTLGVAIVAAMPVCLRDFDNERKIAA